MKNLHYFILGLICFGCTDRDPNYSIDDNAVVIENKGRDGCPEVVYPRWQSSPYVLPYKVGQTFRVELANCSLYNHAPGEIDQFAFDFLMPLGTEVVATREGLVVFTDDKNEEYSSSANIIVVQHTDQTFGIYSSLTKDGALAEVGELVERGQVIAKSGATGFSAFPHIHFIVTKGSFVGQYEGVPITFSNTDPNPLSLNSFTSYPSYVY